jgi:hypothetical protein
MLMLPLSSQTLLNDSTCCVPCIALKKALVVKTERNYLKDQLGVTRDSIIILDKIVFNQDSIIKIKDAQIALYVKNEGDYKQLIENKDKEVTLYKNEYKTALKRRNLGYISGILGIISGLLIAL